ncbi:hypothetical protein [Streptomyces sp. CLI2509]|nr:hypothetical protein [Streptomyces sp. CLI2509]
MRNWPSPVGSWTVSKYEITRPVPHSRSLMKVGGTSGLLPFSPFAAHCAY